jgi:tRNA threonylcarbamoyladenosine biosynthesis protein TsaE
MEYVSKSEKETARIAGKIINNFPDCNLFGLSGNLGSGKTVFVKGVAKAIGVKENITSPTFVVMKMYQGRKHNLIHIDAYRLEGRVDLETIGFGEFSSDSMGFVFIEWPEKVFDTIPKDMKIINFEYLDEKTRKITI